MIRGFWLKVLNELKSRGVEDILIAVVDGLAEAALGRLDAFESKWARRHPTIAASRRRAWDQVAPLFAFPPEIRTMIDTTNAVESLHRSLRKIIKTGGSFPSDDAALKLLFPALRNAGPCWHPPVA